MNKLLTIQAVALSFLLASCNLSNKKSTDNVVSDSQNLAANDATGIEIIYKDGITLTEISQETSEASLKLVSPSLVSDIAEGKVKFDFEVKGVDVGDNDGAINFSLNNAKVNSYPSNSVSKTLYEDEYVFTSFIVDENGVSIKDNNAIVANVINIGNAPDAELGFSPDSSHIFYNKPYGTYVGEAAKKILLDFVVLNAELSESGKRVRVLINGTEFVLNSWKSYTIEGLPMGENVVRVDLVNDLGVVPGPYNRGDERTITLVADPS